MHSLAAFGNVIEGATNFRGQWAACYFKNDFPITLELACGKGEYTIALAQRFPNRNFIGVDIKGVRLWSGAKRAAELNLKNAAFLRIKIDRISDCFAENEVDEIWLTFPDPYPKHRRGHHRLTSARFLNMYQKILKPGGLIHLKTDEAILYEYTQAVVKSVGGKVHEAVDDLYAQSHDDDLQTIKTTYEAKHLVRGDTIKYVKFSLV
jgi:tRNA (guanine-N7-)-methyltransferase